MNFKSIGNKIKGNPKMIEGTVYSMLIICGILGAAPFAIAMPFVNFTWTIICTFLSGLIIASAFSSIVVYATDLMPDKVGLIAGIFFGDVWFGRTGVRLLRLVGRQDKRRVHLSGECFPPIARHHRWILAEYAIDQKLFVG